MKNNLFRSVLKSNHGSKIIQFINCLSFNTLTSTNHNIVWVTLKHIYRSNLYTLSRVWYAYEKCKLIVRCLLIQFDLDYKYKVLILFYKQTLQHSINVYFCPSDGLAVTAYFTKSEGLNLTERIQLSWKNIIIFLLKYKI